MTASIDHAEVIMPGGVELTLETEPYLALSPDTHLLSVACGTGELELYLAGRHGCRVFGVDAEILTVEANSRAFEERG
ncbi:MAG: hypothetical protein ISS56_16910, partial [Anaerolineae bacterium]|nr:hypothetical protein [Anaerolineae bacterium]